MDNMNSLLKTAVSEAKHIRGGERFLVKDLFKGSLSKFPVERKVNLPKRYIACESRGFQLLLLCNRSLLYLGRKSIKVLINEHIFVQL